MSKTHCRFCDITVMGIYINCPKCGTNLMYPDEPKTEPEPYELADAQAELSNAVMELTANLIKAADDLAKAFHKSIEPIATLYAALSPEQKEEIAKIHIQREGGFAASVFNDKEPKK